MYCTSKKNAKIPLLSKSLTNLPEDATTVEDNTNEGFNLKKSLNAQCLVRSRVEDPQIQAARAEVVKNKSVAQLSQVTSLSDIPIPTSIQTMVENARNREKTRLLPVSDTDSTGQVFS